MSGPTMIEFQIEKVWDGWLTIQTPDDVDITIKTDSESDTFAVALSDLLELYGYAVHEKPGSLLVGTGTFVELEITNGGVRFQKYRIDVETTFEDLRTGLEPALKAIFRHKDEQDDTEIREEQLGHVQQNLEKEGVGFDVEALYDSLSGTSGS